MNIFEKIKVLAESSKYDLCSSSASKRVSSNDANRIGNAASGGICHSFTPDGRCISLYKTLYSNACSFDCKYCMNSNCKNKNITEFKPDELAKVFMKLYLRNYVEGLFLSSGVIKDPDKTTQKMLDAIKLVRQKYNFEGYIHLKAIPGVSKDLLKQASEMSDRLSINIEVPNKSRMNDISNIKDYKKDILKRQSWIKKNKTPAGQTTQFVVGCSNETDKEILSMMKWEYDEMNLKRTYFSGFLPIKGTKLENKTKPIHNREVHLYNIDWLYRVYKIGFDEINKIYDENNNLPNLDPKILIAKNFIDKPIDINNASYEELIRIPGIGLNSTYKIMELQNKNKKITKKSELKNLGVVLKRAEPFIKINGWNQRTLESFDTFMKT
jgi:putative DNA modification/repair radical SAM protein